MEKNKIIVISNLAVSAIMGVSLFILPVTSVPKALTNIKNYRSASKEMESVLGATKKVESQIISTRQAIGKSNTSGISLDDVSSVTKAVTSLEGISSIKNTIVGINGTNRVPVGPYVDGQSNIGIEGIQYYIVAENLQEFLPRLYSLNIPFETINILEAENTVVFIVNFKGGI